MSGLLGSGLHIACMMIATAACGAVNVRPYLTPFPDAPSDTLRASADAVIRHLTGVLASNGAPVRVASPEEGYVETEWFDARRAADTTRLELDPVVKLRFWVDPIGQGQAKMVGEAVTRAVIDPSLPPRLREMMVPADHPGGQLLGQIMAETRERFHGAGRRPP